MDASRVMTGPTLTTAGESTEVPGRWITAWLAAILVWLVIQTPLVLIAYQYGGLPAPAARALLLVKDAVVAALLIYLLIILRNRVALAWYDWCAIAYVAIVGVYSITPWLLGSELPFAAVAASARAFVMPVELYALGRLSALGGARESLVVSCFLAVSAVAAGLAVAQYLLTPPQFWVTVLDMPRFIREVQGLPGARSLWDISMLGHYGVGESGQFFRAVGPFTHPVGASHYFVLPLVLSVTQLLSEAEGARRRQLIGLGAVALFTAALLVPISRGSWIAAAVAVAVSGVLLSRFRTVAAGVMIVGLFLLVVPPFNLSIISALSLEDSSVVGHGEAVGRGVETALENPIGLGLGESDHLGSALGGSEAAGVGENLYLSLLVAVGPLGLLAFSAWVTGAALSIWGRVERSRRDFIAIALLGTLIGYAASAMTSSSLMRFTTSASFWLLLGLAAHGTGIAVPTLRSLRRWRPFEPFTARRRMESRSEPPVR